MFITDSQVHIWGPNTPEHPWSTGGVKRHEGHIFGVHDLIEEMDRAGVARAVIVTPSWFTGNTVSLQAAVEYPHRFGVMGAFDFLNSDPNELKAWRELPGMLGIRLKLSEPKLHEIFASGGCDRVLAVAESSRIPVMVSSPGEPSKIFEVARRFTELKIMVDHLNIESKTRDDELGPAVDSIMALSDYENVALKLTGMPAYVNEDYPYPSLHSHIKRVIDTFGVDRCMWGSDLTRMRRSYVDCVRLITEGVDFLSDSEKEMLMNGSISHWLDWPRVDI